VWVLVADVDKVVDCRQEIGDWRYETGTKKRWAGTWWKSKKKKNVGACANLVDFVLVNQTSTLIPLKVSCLNPSSQDQVGCIGVSLSWTGPLDKTVSS
jgi:hypothetical protein